MSDNLVLCFTKYGRFVGKQAFENEVEVVLSDVIEFQHIHTDKGIAMIGLQTAMSGAFLKDKTLVFRLDNKSPYFTQYYQASSGITAEASPNFFRK